MVNVKEILLGPESKPQLYLQPDEKYQANIKSELAQWCSSDGTNLIVDNFDDEQIWQQIELINKGVKEVIPLIAKCSTKSQKSWFGLRGGEESEPEAEPESGAEDDESKDESVTEEEKDETEEEEEDGDADEEEDEGEDLFFDENQMEKFVESQENQKDVVEDDEEEEIDYFQDEPLEEDDHEEPHYDEFFPKPSSGALSSFEKRKLKLKEKIERLENEALSEKPWQMKGEVDATGRPVNSLLEQFVEFDHTGRPAPVITEEVTLRLEDIILKRIKERVFDDVVRKIKPVRGPHELKKEIVLDQEKSKLSLAQVYEKEYLKEKNKATGVATTDEVLPENKQHIVNMMVTLFRSLDCLSNFHYTPKPASAELRIVTNLPAVTVEEPVPETVADAALLAPAEVAGAFKHKSLLGKDERSETDKKRERRKKKERQGRTKEAKELRNAARVGGKKPTLLQAEDTVKTSTQFFTKLEDQVKNGITKEKRKLEENDKRKVELKTKKLKM